jgi:hypothetical protein
MEIQILDTDQEFTDSPDTGWPECTCSRCGNMIKESEMPLRCFDPDRNTEYRFCEPCQSKHFGINYTKSYWADDDWNDYPIPVEQ